jgi:hypothetical protein
MRTNSELFARLNESRDQSESESRLLANKVFLEVLLDCRDLLANCRDLLVDNGEMNSAGLEMSKSATDIMNKILAGKTK